MDDEGWVGGGGWLGVDSRRTYGGLMSEGAGSGMMWLRGLAEDEKSLLLGIVGLGE